jgi:hypothetical protein
VALARVRGRDMETADPVGHELQPTSRESSYREPRLSESMRPHSHRHAGNPPRQRYPRNTQQDSMKVSIREQAIDHNLSTVIDRSCPLQSQNRSRRNKTSGSHPARHPVQHACRPPRHAKQSAVHVVLGACCSNVLVEISFQLE